MLGFSTAAWKLAPRDRFIGWTPEKREKNLPLVVDNPRFLILPWIEIPNLGSHILALVRRRLPEDWTEPHAVGGRPVPEYTPASRCRPVRGGQMGDAARRVVRVPGRDAFSVTWRSRMRRPLAVEDGKADYGLLPSLSRHTRLRHRPRPSA